jgi:hypothetical protein
MLTKTVSALTLVLCAMLSACGGGSDSSLPSVTVTPSLPPPPAVPEYHQIGSITTDHAPLLNFVPAQLDQSTNAYIVMAGLLYSHNPPANHAAPVRVFRINADGTGQDATQQILGELPTAATAFPVIADFNRDGIDDIFLAGMLDHSGNAPGVAYISRAGQTHRRVNLPELVWTHDVATVDIDHDGDLDVVNSHGQMWLNDGQGNFVFRDHHWNLNFGAGHWMHGSGVCAGDFNRTGRTQLVITDLMQDSFLSPKSDTVIYELDANLQPIREHTLPMPTLDRNTITEVSHEVTCLVVDVNSDSRPDILVFSRSLPPTGSTVWLANGQVQVLINRGNWQFEDVSLTALPGYNINQHITYVPWAQDFNGDGRPDLWFTSFEPASQNHAVSAWVNRGNSVFASALTNTIETIKPNGGMVPIRSAQGWRLVFARINGNTVQFWSTNTVYQII